MSDRAFLWSMAGHGLLLVLLLIGGLSLPHAPPRTELAIRATVVQQPGKARPKATQKPSQKPAVQPVPPAIAEAPAEPRPEPRPEPKPTPPPEADPEAQKRKAEQAKKKADEQAARLAREESAKQKAAKQKAEQQKAEKQRQEAVAAERAKAEAEKQKAAREKADADRRQAAKEAADRELDRQLEEEERLLAATDSGALADYVAMIRQKVERNWVRPPGARPGLECEVLVTQIPGGQVTAVQMGRCNADDAVRRSIEAAVLRASPLPPPDDSTLFERNLRFTFKPEQ